MDSDGHTLATGSGPRDSWRQTVPLSELEAATQLAFCTTGDLIVHVDAKYVVRGVRRGPDNPPKQNAYQWRRFWGAVGGRGVVALKIKAHLTLEAALGSGTDAAAWAANRAADELADQAAAAQLPRTAVAAVQRHDAEALQVKQHLAAVALAAAKQAAALYGPSSRPQRRAEAAERAKARAAALTEATRLTAHRLDERSGRCLTCLRGPSAALPRLAFLASECLGRPHQIHPSHTLHLTRGLWWCERCGGSGSKRFKKLKGACEPPTTSSGKRTL